MILARSMGVTGALQSIGQTLTRLWLGRPQVVFLVTLLTAATPSMFLNNTPVVAAIMPLLVSVSLEAKTSASSVLMPVGFASIIVGMSTTIGTSTNLLVVSIAHDMGMRELQMFDFALPVFIAGGVAILYLWLVAPRLLPERQPPLTDISPGHFDSRLRINAGSRTDGLSLADLMALAKGMLRIRRTSFQ
jgi:Na+/H+ antiporter NhaD/arsenite permease-like protein